MVSYSRADEEEQELGSFVGVLRADEELVCLSLYEEQVSRCPVSALALRLRVYLSLSKGPLPCFV